MNDIPEVWNIQVSQHAVLRYRERNGDSSISDMQAANRIRNIIYQGKEYEIKNDILRVKQLLKHDLQPSRYFKEGRIMVILQNRLVVTCHLAQDPKFTPKKHEAHQGPQPATSVQ